MTSNDRPTRRTRDGVVEAPARQTRGGTVTPAPAAGNAAPAGGRPLRDALPSLAPAPSAPAAGTAPQRAVRGAPAAAAPQAGVGRGGPHVLPPIRNGVMPSIGTTTKPDDMLIVIQELTEVLRDENHALASHLPMQLEAGLERKQRLTRVYNDQMTAISRNPRHLQSLPEEKRAILKAAAQKLDVLVAENNRLLKVNIDAVECLLGAVVEAVRTKSMDSKIYSERAQLGGIASEPRHLAVAMNREY